MNSVHKKILGVLYLARIIENPKELILNKSKEILYNEGYSKLSMRHVAKECDIALGTIYNYYPTKKDLVMEMMIDYWKEYFFSLEKLISSDDPFYIKLNKLFDELKAFIKTFKEIWLKREFYDTPDFVESGLEKEFFYMKQLVEKVEFILIEESSKINSEIHLKQSSNETAEFIVLNFITIIQMPFFKYSSFETILKELFK